MNLFLGNFRPAQGGAHLWELESDYYLHHDDPRYPKQPKHYQKWFTPDADNESSEKQKQRDQNPVLEPSTYSDYYAIEKLTSFDDEFAIKVPTMSKEADEYVQWLFQHHNSITHCVASRANTATLGETFCTEWNAWLKRDDQKPTSPNSHDLFGPTLPVLEHSYKSTSMNTEALLQQRNVPRVSVDESKEYARYMAQTKSLSSVADHHYPDYAVYDRYSNFAKTYDDATAVSSKDREIYQKAMNVATTAGGSVPASVREMYRRWLNTNTNIVL